MSAKIGRNDRCPCGSGQKYKRCCGEEGGRAVPRTQTSVPLAPLVPLQSLDQLQPLMSLANAGRHAELEQGAQALLERQPESGDLWRLLSLALWMQGKDALPALDKAAQLLPLDAEAQGNLGTALRARGRFEEARVCYDRALAIEPDFVEAHNNLGSVLRDLGQAQEAIMSYRRALALDPTLAIAHCNLGMTHRTLGHTAEALACFGEALKIQPDLVDAHTELGSALQELGRFDSALASFHRAATLQPRSAQVHLSVGSVYLDLARFDEAQASLEAALVLDPRLAAAHCKLGAALRLKGRAADAHRSCRRALDADPNLGAAWILLSQLQADQGDFGAAENSLRRAMDIDPDNADAWAAMPGLRKMTLDDSDWAREALRIVANPLAPRREAALRYAIGKFYDDVQNYDEAFAHYRRANDLPKQSGARYDPREVTREFEHLMAFYDAAWFERHRPGGNASSRPVFVVGMPRSGTTLVEQILGAHPEAFGAGEFSSWVTATTMLLSTPMDNEAAGRVVAKLAQDYLDLLDGQSRDALCIIDKTPINFKCLGLIHAAFPRARILHMRRDPIDTCLSIYFQDFHSAHNYANDLDDLVHYHREYSRVMHHWRSLLPQDVLLDVSYEALTQEPEAWSRRLVQFLGLPWDARCLDFHRAGGTILTFSKWQARQKITTASVRKWRRYERFIAPLMSLAEPAPLIDEP